MSKRPASPSASDPAQSKPFNNAAAGPVVHPAAAAAAAAASKIGAMQPSSLLCIHNW